MVGQHLRREIGVSEVAPQEPPAIRSFHFAFAEDSDLEPIIELCRPMKLSNFVPTLFRVSNDLYLCGSEGESAEYAAS